jgi:pantetheine-phosphate adenylyltransferase
MIGLYAGSFDPIHLGHVDVIEAASCRCSHLWIAAAVNPSKGSGLLSLEDRQHLLRESLSHLGNVSVTTCDRLLVSLAEDIGADTLIRGAARDGGSEIQMAITNLAVGEIPTALIPCRPDHAHISSTYVRQLLASGGPAAIRELVPAPVYEWALAAVP